MKKNCRNRFVREIVAEKKNETQIDNTEWCVLDQLTCLCGSLTYALAVSYGMISRFDQFQQWLSVLFTHFLLNIHI